MSNFEKVCLILAVIGLSVGILIIIVYMRLTLFWGE